MHLEGLVTVNVESIFLVKILLNEGLWCHKPFFFPALGHLSTSRGGWDHHIARGDHRESLLPVELCPPEQVQGDCVGEARVRGH